jgi:hypothetical protein
MARADAVGKDRDTKDTTSAADRAASGKGYSGKGGLDSPSEGGPGPGKGLGGAASGGSYSGKGGQDSPSEGGPGPGKGLGGGDYSGQGRGADSPSEGGPGRGVSGSSDRDGGEGSRYSGRGGLNSPGEVARGADGFGLNGSSVDAPRSVNYNDLGIPGSGGLYTAAMGGRAGSLAGSVGSYTTARSLEYGPSASMESYRQAEIQSMEALNSYGKEVVSVIDAGPGWTTVELRDGTVERRSGTRASRNFNPGNIEYGSYAKSKGAIGTDGRFAVFSSPQQGIAAMKDLVFGPNYAGKTINQAIEKYAPSFENDSKAYAAQVAAAAGVPVDTPTSDLSEEQKDRMIEAMTVVEGGKPYDVETVGVGRWGTEGYKADGKPTTPEAVSTPVSDPVDANVAAYTDYGRSRAAAPTSVATGAARTARFRDMYISPHLTLEQQGFTQAYADAQTPEVDRAPVGTAVPEVDTRSAAQPSVSVPSAVAQPVGSGRAVTPTTAAQSVTPVGPAGPAVSPVATESQAVQPTQQRGIAAQLAAGGIDVLAGLAPGVGMAASVFNAGAALTGNRTIGERLVDGFLSGEDKGGPARTRESDSLLVRDKQEDGGTKADETPAEEPAKDKNRFVRLYLTPTEKWGAATI